MCEARITDVGRVNNEVQSEAGNALEQLRKIIENLSLKQIYFETEIKTLKNTILEL